ncbi:MAG: RNA polymerase factor sigma-54 [Deltaproteobacteria bacterium]|nr:RNA polymerase factor sigma-54 [Deltaproteobacteria bacterium]
MALEIKQSLKLSQQLIMTPQLQQAIRLLQLSRLELVEYIDQELCENPVLESVQDESVAGDHNIENGGAAEEPVPEPAKTDISINEVEWENYLESYGRDSMPADQSDSDRSGFESVLTRSPSLADHLLWQFRLTDFSEEEAMIGANIIGNLDENGYLTVTVEELAPNTADGPSQVERVLKRIQEFDPLGVAARDLRECLLIQVRLLNLGNTLVETILQDHFDAVVRRDFAGIGKKLGIPTQEIAQAVEIIGQLEPKPGRSFGTDNPMYISPDIFVYKLGDDYVVLLNDDGLPRLRVNSFYRKSFDLQNIDKQSKDYIQEKMRSALWLIRSIHQRQRTIYKVACSIVRFQREFLDKGIEYLRPMVLRDVAEDVSMHESTVGRVTSGKYIHTPQGVFELKYFFNTGIKRIGDDDIASESIKNRVRTIIKNEDPARPYSDQAIMEILRRENVSLARRTVAKYREMLKILPSNKRRKSF